MTHAESTARAAAKSLITIHCDGAARGNPGEAAAGVTLHGADGTLLAEIARYLGYKTNNEAEYTALILALEEAKRIGARGVKVRCDSELMVKQIKGEYRVKNERLKPLYDRAKKLAANFKPFSIEHIRREFNTEADALANRALDER